jgi:5'-nucleotidase
MTVLLADRRPDLVLAGINDKRNVGEDVAYSGTLAIAREATFWGIPAVAWSADDSNVTAASLHRLIQALWRTRAEWSSNGRWLSVNLPATLPTAVEAADVASDKIATACDVLERSPDRIVLRLRRGRPGTAAPGDENAILTAGAMSVVSHRWQGDSAVPPGVLAALRHAAE